MSYIKKKSQLQEKRTAKEFNGNVTIASGALYFQKADVRTGSERTSMFNDSDFLIENKFTDKETYKLERKIWEKIAKEALHDNFRTPLMQIDLQDLHLVIMDYNDYLEYFEGYNVAEYVKSTRYNSIILDKSNIESLVVKTQEEGKIPAIQILFTANLRFLNLVVLIKNDFINR